MNKVWVYIISKDLNDSDLARLQIAGEEFTAGWTAHQSRLAGSFEIFQKKILFFRVNENVNEASGCSIDKLLRFIKSLEQHFGIELLNRFIVAYKKEGGIKTTHSTKIKELVNKKEITADTVIFNTAISTEDELKNWEVPLKNTWLNKYLEKV